MASPEMPCYDGSKHPSNRTRMVNPAFLRNTTSNKDWSPKSSQVRGNESARYRHQIDNLSGGLQYWCKQQQKLALNTAASKLANTRNTVKKILKKASEKCRCDQCGGYVSEEGRYKTFVNHYSAMNKCAFQSQYCDVLGPCADCALARQRMSIVQKHNYEFPGIEVTPRRLVAPSLAEVMIGDKVAETSYVEPGRSVLQLPSISPGTIRYMRREAGSTKQKRKECIPHQEDTHKKYIEIRLPKI